MNLSIQQTFVIIKPDAIQRGISGEIIHRFEKKGLKIVALKMMQLQEALLREHYAHVVDQPFYEELAGFMKSSPVICMCLEGLNAIELVRKISGTDLFQYGTIRGDYSTSRQRNVIHSSDSVENAQEEIKRFFTQEELLDYQLIHHDLMYAKSDQK